MTAERLDAASEVNGQAWQSEQMFRKAVESAPNAMVITDEAGTIVLVNAQTERLFGYPRESLVGRDVEMLVPPQFRGGHARLRRGFLEQPKARPMGAGRDLFGLRQDGTQFPIEIGLNPMQVGGRTWILSSIVDITERKRAEEMFRLAVEAAPNAMLMADQDGRILLVNAQTEALFGYTRQELLGMSVENLVPPQFREAHPGHRSEFLRKPRARSMGAGRDLFGLRKDGSQVPIEIGLTPIESEKGTWILSSIVDITERKHAEQMFRLAVEAAPNAMLMAAEDGRIVLANAQAEKLFGYNREELLASTVDRLVPDEFRNAHAGHRAAFRDKPRAREMGLDREIYGLKKDGSRVPLEIGLNPVKTEKGDWVLSSIVDISERKRAQEELRLSEERFRLTVENARDYGIIMLSPEGIVQTWNAGAEAISMYRGVEVIGSHFSLLYSPEAVEAGLPCQELADAAKGRFETECIRVRKDGSRFWADVVMTAVRDKSGALVGFVEVTRDITDRKRSIEEIARLNQDLERRVQERTLELTAAMAELETFSYSVAHDLRAPLRQIAGYATIFEEDYSPHLDEEARRLVKKVTEGAQHMGHLIDGLLNLASVGRQPLSLTKIPMNELVELALDDLRSEFKDRDVGLDVEPLGLAYCEPTLVKQVLVNLLSNALKYTRPRPRAVIRVTRMPDAGHAVFRVEDNGVGFDMKYGAKLFKVFQRLHHPQEFEGTGVGLATVNRIVQRHGGRLWAESEPDKGAAFSFSLPAPMEGTKEGE